MSGHTHSLARLPHCCPASSSSSQPAENLCMHSFQAQADLYALLTRHLTMHCNVGCTLEASQMVPLSAANPARKFQLAPVCTMNKQRLSAVRMHQNTIRACNLQNLVIWWLRRSWKYFKVSNSSAHWSCRDLHWHMSVGTERCLRTSGESSECITPLSTLAVGCDDPRTVAGTLSLPLAGLLSCTVEAAAAEQSRL